ncbi:hypothetical protein [Botrimarina mediterranea]|uniref:hypothetical protein n=1 Tax=Botrimarina mediterranea TaxID=2528022 RepID=UPI00119FA83B
MAQIDPETGEMTDARPELHDWKLTSGVGVVVMYLFRFVIWLTTPICLLLEILFDWMGFTGTIPYLELDAGIVGYIFGMVDAWVPLHEIIFQGFALVGVMIIWNPFRILIKFLFPGVG